MSNRHRKGHRVRSERKDVTKRFDEAEIEGRSAIEHCIDTDEWCLPDVESIEWDTSMFADADGVVFFPDDEYPEAPIEIKGRQYKSDAWDSWFIRKHKMHRLFSLAESLSGDVEPVVLIGMSYTDGHVRIWEVHPEDLDDYDVISKRLKDKTVKASGWSTVDVYLLPPDHVSLVYSTIDGEAE